jgi:CO/xanthine dehydrogenase Mo-binding subunit
MDRPQPVADTTGEDQAMANHEQAADAVSATLTRRRFLRRGGALVVGLAVARSAAWPEIVRAAGTNNPEGSPWTEWFEIRADNTITMFTGKVDFGQSSVYTAFRQIVAEELNTTFEAITTTIVGDTDRTPDGGISATFLHGGKPNVRKAAAYVYQALLDLAATKLGVSKSALTVKDGIVTGGGKSISYGQLVSGSQLQLTIPLGGTLTHQGGLEVLGNPPVKPVSEYTIVGKSYLNPATPGKITAKTTWITDVRMPGMLHARVVHPKTLGSTLISAGEVDKTRYPNARVVVKGNLVGVIAPTEWEAIGAAQQVAASTKWTEWKGLPGSDNLHKWMREEADWKTAPVTAGGTKDATSIKAAKTLSATYELPYMKHAPIGPTVAVGDVRPDGKVYLSSCTQNPSMLRGEIAKMLGTPIDNVVVRWFPGAGHYGRSNGGNAGAEDEAVILSKAVGAPVRVQWMRADDMQWSTNGTAAYSDIQIGIDAGGKLVSYEADHYMPAFHDDRPIGALLAGLPTMTAPDIKAPEENFSVVGTIVNQRWDPWVYGRVPHLAERAHGTYQVGQKASPLAVGLRNHSMRTPGQFSQHIPRELAISEAAALAGVDPLQFRLDHTNDERLKSVLIAVRDASGWQHRATPTPGAGGKLHGWGVSAMQRGAYWACVCEVTVDAGTGKIAVDKCTIAVDCGIVINPLQLKRQIQGGAMMGLSHVLHEEVTFDQGAVTNRDWRTYPILTMGEVPEIQVVILNHPERGVYDSAAEAPNALPPPAVAGAFLNATGRAARRLPLKPAYVQQLLKA